MSTRMPRPLGPAPSEPALREAALRHLARYAATQAQLLRVLDRRVDRWLRAARQAAPDNDSFGPHAAAAKQAARRVAAALVTSGVIDDAAYAQGRARTLLRSGRSRAKVAQHLLSRGIDAATVRAAVPANDAHDLAAALLLARKRGIGAFAATELRTDPAAHRRALGILARAGFTQSVAHRALAATDQEAQDQIEAMRRR